MSKPSKAAAALKANQESASSPRAGAPKSPKGGETKEEDADAEEESKRTVAAYKSDPKADALMKEAEKKLNSRGIMSIFGSSTVRTEEAVELFIKAAAQYKVSKNYNEAGAAFVRAGELNEKVLKQNHDAVTNYINAAKTYKNCNTRAAIKYFQISVDLLMEENKFSTAARHWKDIAELHEKEMQYKEATAAYQKAADCYEADDSSANAQACHIKVAALSAELEDYKKAIEIYEKVSIKALDGSSAGRWGVKDYLFNALLCQFVLSAQAHDMTQLETAIEKYKDMSPTLDGTREIKLIEDLCAAFKEDDLEAFSDAVFRYDEIYKLNNWTAKVLLAVKNALKNGPAEGAEPDFS